MKKTVRGKPPSADASDSEYMRMAVAEARSARAKGEVPVGALVVLGGKVIARAGNCPISSCDPSAHAEMLAIRRAAKKIGNYRLAGAEIFVTKEPCVMCAGAMAHARIKRLVYGCRDEKSGAAGSVFGITSSPSLNHTVDVKGGVMASECSRILKEFFRNKRKKTSKNFGGEMGSTGDLNPSGSRRGVGRKAPLKKSTVHKRQH
jgi:tRNA(adenine34) deaminase